MSKPSFKTKDELNAIAKKVAELFKDEHLRICEVREILKNLEEALEDVVLGWG